METIAEFLAELHKLATHCQFGEQLNEALGDCLVCGLRTSAIQKRLLSEADLDLPRALRISQCRGGGHQCTEVTGPRSREGRRSLHPPKALFLLSYRTTPHSTTGVSPCELLLDHKLRTGQDLLLPDTCRKVTEKQLSQKVAHDSHSSARGLLVGQRVMVRNM